jgi:nucleoside-diphosphate-sugar epimerase
MQIVVTGGAGFIGSNLVDRLINDGHHVIVLDNLSTGKLSNLNSKANLLKVDLTEIEQSLLDKLISGVDYVFHVAAKARVQPSIADPATFHDHNVNATLKLLEACRKSKNVKRFIFSSSSSVYGNPPSLPFEEKMPTNPISPYAVQKLICEEYCKMYSKVYGIDTVNLRYFNVYGNRQPVEGAYCTILGIFTKQSKNKEPLTITNDGEQKRDFTHVNDIVEANIKAMNHSSVLNGESFNIGYGKSVSINEIASYFGGEKKYIGTVLEPRETLADNSKAREILGWVPQVAITNEYVQQLLNG